METRNGMRGGEEQGNGLCVVKTFYAQIAGKGIG